MNAWLSYILGEKNRPKRRWSMVLAKKVNQNVGKLSYCRSPPSRTSLNYHIFVSYRWPRRHRTIVAHCRKFEKFTYDSTGKRCQRLYAMQSLKVGTDRKRFLWKLFSSKGQNSSQHCWKPPCVNCERSSRIWRMFWTYFALLEVLVVVNFCVWADKHIFSTWENAIKPSWPASLSSLRCRKLSLLPPSVTL